MSKSRITAQVLRERCERLERNLVARKLITADEAAQLRKPRSIDDWWERYAELRSYARRIEWEKVRTGESEPDDAMRDSLEEIRTATLQSKPLVVRLDDGTTVDVHPKSYNAIIMIRALDYTMSWLLESADEIAAKATPHAPDLLPRIFERIGFIQNRILEIIVHPGPGYDAKHVETPREFEYSPLDVLTLQRAYNSVNVLRMMALPVVTEKKKDGKQEETGWSAFFVLMGVRKKVDPALLMQDVDLVKLIMEARLYAKAVNPIEGEEAA